MSNIKHTARRILATIPALFAGVVAFADDSSGLNGLKNVLKGWFTTLVDLVTVVVGIMALVYLVKIIILMMKGEKAAAEQLFSWLIGFAGGIIVLQVVGKILLA